jgi:alpha-aminoadipate carrier protein LysW
MATCPECEAIIDLGNDEIEEGQKVDCPECDAELEVVNTNPLEFDLISSDDDEEGKGTW